MGIPSELLPNLFQFGRTTKGERGNGMGLWTVKHILDRHHAAVEVESQPGQGSKFRIRWPRTFVADSAAASTAQLHRA
jgi:signal transduction histidine kinase